MTGTVVAKVQVEGVRRGLETVQAAAFVWEAGVGCVVEGERLG